VLVEDSGVVECSNSQCSSDVSDASALMIEVMSVRQNWSPSGVAQCSTSQVSAVIRSSAAASGVVHGRSSTMFGADCGSSRASLVYRLSSASRSHQRGAT
jgi:hypothetical protein